MPKTKKPIVSAKLMRNKSCINGTYPVYVICQFHGRGQYATGYRCSPNRFVNGRPIDYPQVDEMVSKVRKYILKLDLEGKSYTASSVLEVLRNDDVLRDQGRITYIEILERIISERGSSVKTEASMRYAYNVLVKFIGRADFPVIDVDEVLIRRWIKSVEKEWKALSIKSVLARISDVWNTYIRLGGDRSLYPFDKIRLSSFKSDKVKQIMSIEQIRALKSYYINIMYAHVRKGSIYDRNGEFFALTCYLMSFMMFGLALVDLLKLKVDCIEEKENGWLFKDIRRSKTRTPVPLFLVKDEITSFIVPHLLSTAHLRCGYLFAGIQNNSMSLLSDSPKRVTIQVSNCTRIVNASLKKVWRKVNNLYNAGIPLDYTYYSMRSSAASIYLSMDGANVYTLAHLMGRSVEGISTYVAEIKSSEELMKERMKLVF